MGSGTGSRAPPWQAAARGMLENVNFCVEATEYQMLFTEADRKPRADALVKMYIEAGAELPVNLPDTMIRAPRPEQTQPLPSARDGTSAAACPAAVCVAVTFPAAAHPAAVT